jgi:hypothetical protein
LETPQHGREWRVRLESSHINLKKQLEGINSRWEQAERAERVRQVTQEAKMAKQIQGILNQRSQQVGSSTVQCSQCTSVKAQIQDIFETQCAQADEIASLHYSKKQVLVKLSEMTEGGQQGAQTLEKVKVETLVQSLQERVVRMETDLERNTIQLRTQQLDFEGRHDQHERKLVKEETSNKSLKEQLDSSTESGRSSCQVNSSKSVSFSPRNMEVPPYSESTEADGKKTLSVRREGDWTCPKCNALVFATRSECYRCHLTKPTSEFQAQIHATSHDYKKELPKIQEELTRVRKREKKAQMLREQLERQLQEQFQTHIASMTLEGATGASSNTP